MAKTTKKEVSKVSVSEQTPESLHEQLVAKQADLFGYQKGLAGGELKNANVIKTTKKEIARIKTALSSKEGKK